jgi:small subunit ribosomal protein S8
MSTDTIADMLTRIRNANRAGHPRVAMPASHFGVEIARVLKEEGYIAGFDVNASGQGARKLDIVFKPKAARGRVLSGVRRISKPGLRVYARKTEIPRVLGGLGIVILSTSRGVMSGQQATKAGLGGEVVCYVW